MPEFHFPGIDSSAARWLSEQRRVDAVKIDTPSIDYGQSQTYDTHQILCTSAPIQFREGFDCPDSACVAIRRA